MWSKQGEHEEKHTEANRRHGRSRPRDDGRQTDETRGKGSGGWSGGQGERTDAKEGESGGKDKRNTIGEGRAGLSGAKHGGRWLTHPRPRPTQQKKKKRKMEKGEKEDGERKRKRRKEWRKRRKERKRQGKGRRRMRNLPA